MTETQQRLRLDRSRYHATIHGERAPGDPHQQAHFKQDGIYFDSHGLHLDHLLDSKTRAVVENRLKKQGKAAPGDDADGASENSGGDANTGGAGAASSGAEVNLESWLRGEAKYDWFAITKAVRERYHANLTKQVDVIEFLVFDHKVVTEEQLAPDLRAKLKSQN